MDVIKKFTRRNLMRNKKRTIVTIIGVMLSTALICAVVGMVATFRQSIIEDYKKTVGDYHVDYGIRGASQYDTIINNVHVEKAGVVQTLAFAKLNEEKTGREYLSIFGVNDTAFSQMNITPLEGRLPENASEIAISQRYADVEGAPKVGDTVRLQLGDRYLPGEDGERIPYYGWDSADEEIYSETGEREYTVVGIVSGSYAVENGGFGVFTRENSFQGKFSHLFVRFDDPGNVNEYMMGIALALNGTGDEYSFSTNTLTLFEGGFSHSSMTMILMLGVIISLIIVGTSVFVISNGFRISVDDKRTQLGMLASVGATKRQIRGIVLREGLYVFLIGTSAGIALGALGIWILDQVVNLLMKDMMRITMVFTFPLWVVIFTVVLSGVTIFLASILPARRASRISPIEVIRGLGDVQTDGKKLKTGKKTKKIFGIGGVIAEKNLKRSRKKYRTTVISLVISIASFIAIAGFVGYGKKLVGEVYNEYDCNIEIGIIDDDENVTTEMKRKRYDEIRRLPGVRDSAYTIGSDGELSLSDWGSHDYAERVPGSDDGEEETIYVHIMLIPEKDFRQYLSRIGVKTNDADKVAILADRDIYYDWETGVKNVGRMTKISSGDQVTFSYVAELLDLTTEQREAGVPDRTMKESTCRVEKVVGEGDLPLGYNGYFHEYGGVLLFLSENYFSELPAYTYLNTLYLDAVDAEATVKTISEMFDKSEEEGGGLRIFNIEEAKQQSNRMILVMEIFLYGFLIVIVLIGLTNVFNTINTNMNLRSREFAMLRSVGMTRKEFTRMIRVEGLIYSLRSLVIGIPIGVLLSWLIYVAIRSRVDYGYTVPWMAILISAVVVILIVSFIMWNSMRRIRKQNIIETIRKQTY